ncbi:MAG: tetratricopeptide repeat protein [Acidobacteria bacterium]|uniref:Tetratricopeptide repeat protein n=1 Tax=Candidatus Polarisedimenticola svalbardensis TaxID=2886004 RepID=A0A8J7CDF5_9BACT|nr:tetratricopeptide repeat protein [Candidatus Polarisedimenticola svalbardensis]
MTQDTKMIIGVAVLVIAGAAGLAALGVLGTRQEPERNQAGERRVVTALPASHKEERPVIQTAVTEVEPFFPEIPRIEPVVPICDALGDTGRIAKGLEHWETGAYGVAAACFGDEAAAGSQRPWVHYMLGLSLWKDGSLDRAAEAMTRAGELDDQSIKTCVNLSRIQNDRGAYDEALVAARQALAIEPDNPKAMFLEGRSLRNQGVRDEALQVLRRSVELDPNNGHALNLLGLTLLEADLETEAVPFLNAAAALLPDVPYIFNNLGMAQERCGNRYEAKVAYCRAVELDGGAGHGALNLARLDPEGIFEPLNAGDDTAEVVEVAEAVN